VAFGSTRVGPLVNRIGTAPLIAAAFIAFAIGYALFLRADLDPTYLTMILPTMLLIGVGFALGFPSVNMQGTTGVADHEQGLAGGLINTSFQVGGAISLAIVSAVLGDGQTGGQAFLDDAHTAIGVVTGVAALGLISALSGLVVRRRHGARAAEMIGA
jgi:MFS family permease